MTGRCRITVQVFARLLVLVLLAVGCNVAQAGLDPVWREEMIALIASQRASEALQRVQAEAQRYPDDADYDYLLGVTALEAGDYALALQSLERVVLMQPAHGGAWLDLAVVYYQLGDTATAQSLLLHVETHFNPPPALRAQIQRVKDRIRGQVAAPAQQEWHANIGLLYGYVTNANGGLATTSFDLTPQGQSPVPVTVNEVQRPHPSMAGLERANAYRLYAHEGGAFTEVVANVLARQYTSESPYDFMNASTGAIYNRPLDAQQGSWLQSGLTQRYLSYGGNTMGYFSTGLLGYKALFMGCQWSGRGELERRQFVLQGYYPSTVPWLGAGAECGGQRQLAGLFLRYGVDVPDGLRPGGTTLRLEGTASYQYQWTRDLNLSSSVYFANYEDQQGYSPLLANGDARYIHRIGGQLSVNYSLPIDARQWTFQLDVNRVQDFSNLPISRIGDFQVFGGLNYHLF